MSTKDEMYDAAWFASVLDAMDDLVLVKGPRSRLLWANRAFRDYYGMSNDELHSLIDGQQSDPDDTLQYVRDDRRVFVERAIIDVPSEPVTDHLGETRFFHTRKCPVFAEGGEVEIQVGVSRALPVDESGSVSQDLRERVHESTRNVRSLVRALPAPVVMLDAAHRIVMWNDAFTQLLEGLGADEGPASELLHADYEEALEPYLPLLDELDAILEGVEPTSRVLELDRGDEGKCSYDVECRTWTDASDAVSGTMAVFHDITELLDNQRRLREANDELAQFNYRVSHDIVAPISTARGYLGLAVDEVGGDDPEELAELLGEVGGQLHRLDELVMDLSNLARASADAPCREAIDLETLVDELRVDCSHDSACNVAIDTDLALAEIDSDPTRIRQVLANLIDNAAKYHDPEESVARVTVRSRREDGAFVIEVSDNGIGIDPEFGQQAFEMFTRGGSSSPGTGLGLYIIRKHVERLGGTLSIASHSKPTVMRISLPDAYGMAA